MSTQHEPTRHEHPDTPAGKDSRAAGPLLDGPAAPVTSDAERAAHARGAWRTVMSREIMVKLTDRSFIIGTVVSLLLIVAMTAAGAWFGGRTTTSTVATIGAPAQSLATAMGKSSGASNQKIEVRPVADAAAAEQLLRDGHADAALGQVDGHWQITFKQGADGDLTRLASQTVLEQQLAATAQKAGTSMPALTAASQVDERSLEGNLERARVAKVAGFIFSVLFMMSALTYGMQIAQSVIEEKQSRIVEILVSAIPVRHLLAGKVLGNTVMALGQMALLVAVGLVGTSFTRFSSLLPAISGALAWYLILFLAGFLALAAIWAAAGAMCTRNEDLQQTSQPMVWILMAVYVLGFATSGTTKVVCSFLPIVSGVLMPQRVLEGSAHWWEAVLALLVNLAFAAVTVWLGERIYRRALLQTQGRLGYRQALKLSD